MGYRISAVDCADDDVAELLRELQDEVFGDTAPRVDPERSEGWWWLAYAEDDTRDIAGFCHLAPTMAAPHTIGYLKRAGVLLAHRGQGLQRRFVRVREAYARRVGFKTLVTDTTDNPASANNLINCGYRTYNPPEPWSFGHAIYWYKDL